MQGKPTVLLSVFDLTRVFAPGLSFIPYVHQQTSFTLTLDLNRSAKKLPCPSASPFGPLTFRGAGEDPASFPRADALPAPPARTDSSEARASPSHSYQ